MTLRFLSRWLRNGGRNGKPSKTPQERAARRRYRAWLEALEHRLAPATFVVNSGADPGNGICDAVECTLREALTAANALPGHDTVAFNIPGAAPHQITVRASALPIITDPVTVDAATQPGFQCMPGTQGTPVILLDGGSITAGVTNGLEITAGGSTVRGLVISLFTGSGLVLRTGGGNRVEGNRIGTNLSGTLANRNLRGGIVANASGGNQIGGATIAGMSCLARNLISANDLNGIGLSNGSNNNRIQGNYIGTTPDGSSGLGNLRIGVAIDSGSQNNLVGTDGDGTEDAAEGNVISGNGWDGVTIGGTTTRGNRVSGNRIGHVASGAGVIPNGRSGVYVGEGTQLNVIGTDGSGGADAAERNIISGNTTDGVRLDTSASRNIVAGNYIGTNINGTVDRGNREDGIEILGGARENRIGTNGDGVSDALERNVISGNQHQGIGIRGGSGANFVAGNFIGLAANGTAALGNGANGISIEGRSDFNRIGTDGNGQADTAERNVIAGNGHNGIILQNVRGTRVAGNYIGTNAAGTAALSNGSACGFPGCAGVAVQSGSLSNIIGTNGDSADNAAERNVISGNLGFGVTITSANSNVVAGNFVGTDATGLQPLRNNYIGVFILDGSQNRIGTDSNGLGDEAERNVIGANGFAVGAGVAIQSPGANNNTVAGNFIGTDATGAVALGIPSNLYGVAVLTEAAGNLIGGTAPQARNVISGNLVGVALYDAGTINNRVLGNFIGTQADGTTRLGNLAHGILVTNGASNTTIGGTAAGQGNVIAFNGGSGVVIAAGTGNAIRGNAIHTNVGLGIDLAADGVTPIDYLDSDVGPNQHQNYPFMRAAYTFGQTLVYAYLHSTPKTTFVLDFYASSVPDPAGYGEGERYLGSAEATTDSNGDVVREVYLDVITAAYEWITVTATDAAGNTSEFSNGAYAEPLLSPHDSAPLPGGWGAGLADLLGATAPHYHNTAFTLLPADFTAAAPHAAWAEMWPTTAAPPKAVPAPTALRTEVEDSSEAVPVGGTDWRHEVEELFAA